MSWAEDEGIDSYDIDEHDAFFGRNTNDLKPRRKTMSTGIAVTPARSYDAATTKLMVLAEQAYLSGLFKTLKNPAEAFLRMAVAAEMGLGPTTGLRAIYLVNGVPAFSANFLAARVKQSRRYNYKVVERTALKCRLEWTEGGQVIGVSEFNMDMAKRAGLASKDPWKQYPESMLFARALTDGVRTYCPDLMMGHNAYTPEEIGGEVVQEDLVEAAPAPAPAPVSVVVEAVPIVSTRPYAPPTIEALRSLIREKGADSITILRSYKVERLEDLTADQKYKLNAILSQ